MNYGRKIIYTDASEITLQNVIDEVEKAYAFHQSNHFDCEKLYKHYKGETDILLKKKEVRPEINHKINENRAYEIVSFHKGYTFGEPIQYVRRENSKRTDVADDIIAEDINALNAYMSDVKKAMCDNSMAEWLYVTGTSYRLTLPNPTWDKDSDEPPFYVYALDPRNTFVVYSRKIGNKPMMAVHYVEQSDNTRLYSVYTKDCFYEFKYGEKGLTAVPHVLGVVPIMEYPADSSRLGVFEIALPLLNTLNELQSNRMDDIVQTVNSFLALLGASMDEETLAKLKEHSMLFLPEGTDAKYLSAAMTQADLQVLKDDIYQSILTICGVPNRNGGSSTSDTGSAVIMRDGWETAEARAKATENIFKGSEIEFLKLVLNILRDTVGTNLRITDIDIQFTRRNYENIATKAQVLVAMLNNPHIHPEVAYASCGMFPDSASAYLQGKAWYEEQMTKWNPVEVHENV